MGFALLMAPDRPLPVVSFVELAATPRSERRRGDQRGRPGPGASRPAFRSLPRTRGPRPALSVLLLRNAVNPNATSEMPFALGHASRRVLPQLLSEAQIPRSNRKRSQGADEFMARIR
jgi:hypothetical protein